MKQTLLFWSILLVWLSAHSVVGNHEVDERRLKYGGYGVSKGMGKSGKMGGKGMGKSGKKGGKSKGMGMGMGMSKSGKSKGTGMGMGKSGMGKSGMGKSGMGKSGMGKSGKKSGKSGSRTAAKTPSPTRPYGYDAPPPPTPYPTNPIYMIPTTKTVPTFKTIPPVTPPPKTAAPVARRLSELPPNPNFPKCNVCGPDGRRVSRPDAKVLVPGQAAVTCHELEQGGDVGFVDPDLCAAAPSFVASCECTATK